MKLSVTIAGSQAKPSAFVVWRGFDDSIRKASEYGYDGVELALKSADDISPKELDALLGKYNMEVSCISTGQVFADLGLYMTNPDPAAKKRAIDVFYGLIDLAADYGKMINIGRTRGFIPEGSTYEETKDLFLQTLGEINERALKKDVTLLIEPVNRYEINFINSLDEGAVILEELGADNCGMMPDVFHMNIEDDYIGQSFIRNKKWVKYIHFADSNRHAPGQGHQNWEEIFSALYTIGFDGWVSAEILPIPEPDIAARQAVDFLKDKIKIYNAKLHSK